MSIPAILQVLCKKHGRRLSGLDGMSSSRAKFYFGWNKREFMGLPPDIGYPMTPFGVRFVVSVLNGRNLPNPNPSNPNPSNVQPD